VIDNLEPAFDLSVAFLLLVPFAIAGITLINTGLGRSRNAAHAMTSALCVLSVAVLTYLVLGGSIAWNAFGFLFIKDHVSGNLAVLLGLFSIVTASLIALGAAADRWRLGSICVSTILFAGVTYPVFSRLAHDMLNLHSGLPGAFFDIGGSGVINVTGGLTALSIAWLLGPRRGKYSDQGLPAAIPAHNAVFVMFGCMLAWVGWIGLNSAGTILHIQSPGLSVLAIANTTFSACAAALTAAAITRIRFRKPDASLIANGWMAGLVASSAGCATLKPATAVLTGLVAGALVVFSVETLEFRLKVDDPCGSVSVHAVCGIWGLLAAGIFSDIPGQFMAQVVGVAALLGFVFPMTYFLNWLLNRFIPYRVSVDGERQGLDLHELGADAYPEFVVHTDEFMQR
jgi:ammonium transporter, Amt family